MVMAAFFLFRPDGRSRCRQGLYQRGLAVVDVPGGTHDDRMERPF